jgi:hypothetical protein
MRSCRAGTCCSAVSAGLGIELILDPVHGECGHIGAGLLSLLDTRIIPISYPYLHLIPSFAACTPSG